MREENLFACNDVVASCTLNIHGLPNDITHEGFGILKNVEDSVFKEDGNSSKQCSSELKKSNAKHLTSIHQEQGLMVIMVYYDFN